MHATTVLLTCACLLFLVDKSPATRSRKVWRKCIAFMLRKRSKRPKFYQLTDEEFTSIRRLAYKYLAKFEAADREDMIQAIALKVARNYEPGKWRFSTLVVQAAHAIVGDWLKAKARQRRIPDDALQYAFSEKEWQFFQHALDRAERGSRTLRKKSLEDHDDDYIAIARRLLKKSSRK